MALSTEDIRKFLMEILQEQIDFLDDDNARLYRDKLAGMGSLISAEQLRIFLKDYNEKGSVGLSDIMLMALCSKKDAESAIGIIKWFQPPVLSEPDFEILLSQTIEGLPKEQTFSLLEVISHNLSSDLSKSIARRLASAHETTTTSTSSVSSSSSSGLFFSAESQPNTQNQSGERTLREEADFIVQFKGMTVEGTTASSAQKGDNKENKKLKSKL